LRAEDLLENPRYATAGDQQTHVAELRREIQNRFGGLACEGAIKLLEGAGIPIARVRTLPEVMTDQHLRDRGTLKPMHRQGSDAPVEHGIIPGFPVIFSGGSLPKLEGGAALGHHNDEIYGRFLHLDRAGLSDLKRRGVI
jgi:crotonobetainyl-CoA:carnitine CoA-transferase CaiB-like acyl-CoA transferase